MKVRNKLGYEQNLCWSCKNVTTSGCEWSADYKPVKGWEAIKGEKPNYYSGEMDIGWYVIDCPKFASDGEATPIDAGGIRALADGIVKQAVKEYNANYKSAIKSLIKGNTKKASTNISKCIELEAFFDSEFAMMLMEGDPKDVKDAVRKFTIHETVKELKL